MDRVATIRQLNDRLREEGVGGSVVVTQGVASLGAPTTALIIAAVRRFSDFTVDNDPYGEHDFGRVCVAGAEVFWKIDYYDRALTFGSPDPADAGVTHRVLTVMLAAEY